MTRAEAHEVLTRHLVLCDAAATGNTHGNTMWRDTAAAIRSLLDDQPGDAAREMGMGKAA